MAILGASGYGAGELLRLLVQHPGVTVVSVTSTSQAGQPIHAVHPHLRGFYDLTDGGEDRPPAAAGRRAGGDFFRAAARHQRRDVGQAAARSFDAPHVKAIDLSGDLRLKDAAAHERRIPSRRCCRSVASEFVYGLPELNRRAILAARCDRQSRLSGDGGDTGRRAAGGAGVPRPAGRSTPRRARPAPAARRRRRRTIPRGTPIFAPTSRWLTSTSRRYCRRWAIRCGQRIELSFVPQSMAVSRGIFATVYATLAEPMDAEALLRRYEQFYAGSPFVRVAAGSPSLEDVVGSNFCDIGVAARGRQVVAMAAIDNLVKGMAGAAIQNMNLMCGLPETTGLWTPSLRPV